MLKSKLFLHPPDVQKKTTTSICCHLFANSLGVCVGCVAGGQSARSPHSARTGAVSARAAKENEEPEDSARVMR